MSNDNWIKCSERLPDIGINVWAHNKDKKEQAIYVRLFTKVGDGSWSWFKVLGECEISFGHSLKDITHWQPLPSPPKE